MPMRVLLALALGACVADEPLPAPADGAPERAAQTLSLPGAAFSASNGELVAPVAWIDGTRIRAVKLAATCRATSTLLVCVTATDPLDAGSTAVLEVCAQLAACGPAIGIVEVSIDTSFAIGERSAIAVTVESPTIENVVVRGAIVAI